MISPLTGGDHAEAVAIFIVLVINAAVGFTMEWRSRGRASTRFVVRPENNNPREAQRFEATVDAGELCTRRHRNPELRRSSAG